jgi:ABC-type enterochelin transport system substrate-binding protein
MAAQAYLERYRQISALDQQKNEFIEVATTLSLGPDTANISCSQELLQRVTTLENSFQQEKLDHERETRFNRDIQLHEMELMDQISRIKTIMVSAAVEWHLNVR